MIDFPNCKINLGLNITEKRGDGFHNIETVFYPVNWCDAIEIIEGGDKPFNLICSGLNVNTKTEENIVFKAWDGLSKVHKLPNLQVYLHKVLPMGAGLGGGSADAAFFLKLVNRKFKLNLNTSQLIDIVRNLGSDCAFFIENNPAFATGKGDVLNPVTVNLSGYYIYLVYPGINCNTKEAYESVRPAQARKSVKEIVETLPIETWRNCLFNDFENSIFSKYPELAKLKKSLYDNGAIYASMSGSGSAVYGIFKSIPEMVFPSQYLSFIGK